VEYKKLLELLAQYKSAMSPSERAAAYEKGQEVDHLPYSLLSPDPAIAEIFGYTTSQLGENFEIMAEVIKRKKEAFGIEGLNVGLGLKTMGHALGSKLFVPKHGIDYVNDYVLNDYSNFHKLTLTDPYKNEVLARLLELAKRLKDRFPDMKITTGVAGPITTAAAIRPAESIMRDTKKNPEMLKAVLDLAVDCSLRWVEVFCREFGAARIGFADPVTCMNMLGKKQFDEFSLPYMKRLIKGITEITGFPPGAHICGKTKALWADLADSGLGSLSIDNCEDLEEAKIAVGNKLALSGNVAPVDVLKAGTIDDVIDACRACILKCGDNPKGFMLDSGCQVPLGTPRKNIEAYIYAVRRYGRGARKGALPRGIREEL
jgi:uroporphyrinogen decarboxylase